MTETAAAPPTEAPPRRVRFWLGVADRLAVGAIAATVLSWGARGWWPLELATHFRVYYAGALAVAVIVYGLQRRWARTGIAVCFLGLHLTALVPDYFSRESVVAGQPTLRCLFANVFTGNREHPKIIDVIRAERPDVIVMAEVNQRWIDALRVLETEYPHVATLPREDNFGIALYSRIPIETPNFLFLGESRVPTVTAKFPFDGKTVTLWGTHPLPPRRGGSAHSRNSQLHALAEAARTAQPAIVIGDLNVTPWSPYFHDLLEVSGLRDSRRGFGIQPTWSNRWVFQLPIDHALVSPDLVVVDRRIGPDIGSDHRPLIVDLMLRKP